MTTTPSPKTDVSVRYDDVHVGDELPTLVIPLTRTLIVATAIASRDYQDVHHDPGLAQERGSPDIFMNILTDTAYCSRFITDWAGPDARITRLAIRLGVPVFPGHTLTYTGEVTEVTRQEDEIMIDVALRAVNELGEHVGGTAQLGVPAKSSS